MRRLRLPSLAPRRERNVPSSLNAYVLWGLVALTALVLSAVAIARTRDAPPHTSTPYHPTFPAPLPPPPPPPERALTEASIFQMVGAGDNCEDSGEPYCTTITTLDKCNEAAKALTPSSEDAEEQTSLAFIIGCKPPLSPSPPHTSLTLAIQQVRSSKTVIISQRTMLG